MVLSGNSKEHHVVQYYVYNLPLNHFIPGFGVPVILQASFTVCPSLAEKLIRCCSKQGAPVNINKLTPLNNNREKSTSANFISYLCLTFTLPDLLQAGCLLRSCRSLRSLSQERRRRTDRACRTIFLTIPRCSCHIPNALSSPSTVSFTSMSHNCEWKQILNKCDFSP